MRSAAGADSTNEYSCDSSAINRQILVIIILFNELKVAKMITLFNREYFISSSQTITTTNLLARQRIIIQYVCQSQI